MENLLLEIGNACIEVKLAGDHFLSLGAIRVQGTELRNPAAPFRPWFDSYEGDVFDRFEFNGIERWDGVVRIALQAVGNADHPFRERRDCSGDLCFRNQSYDAPPVCGDLAIMFKPASSEIGGFSFTGFTYWFEYIGDEVPIHRLLDRATWELGGGLDDVNLVCRNWLTPPRMKIGRETTYSTVGLDKWAGLLPGNMWARWSLLPGFDMQYGSAGVLLGLYDQVSLVRTAIQSNPGEDAIRFHDFHWFEQSGRVKTNPKTMLFCPAGLDHTDALNLWTVLQDRDREMVRRAYDMPEEPPPRLASYANFWSGYRFDSSYDAHLELAEEFGMDQLGIDVCWEQGQALKEVLTDALSAQPEVDAIVKKYQHRNMCCVLDFKVAEKHGGEAGLRRLCDKAAAKGVKIVSWMAAHVHPHSVIVDGPQTLQDADGTLPTREKFAHGKMGAVAAMESGRHPWTGYANSCWTLNLNSPVYGYFKDCLIAVCERTGLDGYLWDSFSNLGWWQVDYSDGSMRPQFDKVLALYAELLRHGIYIQPEAIVAFSSHSCCGLHGGDVYVGDLLGYSYDTAIEIHRTGYGVDKLLRGQAPTEMLFRCLAHRRVPGLDLRKVPRAEWHAESVGQIKQYFSMYKAARGAMRRRTVLKGDAGVLWEGQTGERFLWSFVEQPWDDGSAVEVLSGDTPSSGRVDAFRVYRIMPETPPAAKAICVVTR